MSRDRQYLTQHGPCFQNRFILLTVLYSLTSPQKPSAFWLFRSAVSSCWGSGRAWAVQGLSVAAAALDCGQHVLFDGDKRCQGSYGLCWRGSTHAGEHCHPLETFPRRDDENISCVHPDWSRELPCFPRDGATPKSLLLSLTHTRYEGLETSENRSEFPLVHSVPCSGTAQICAKRQFRLGKGYAIFLYLCFLSHFVKRGHVACNEDICSFCRKLWKSACVCLVPSVAILINSWKLWQT